MADFTICQGDTLPEFVVILQDQTGNPPNLTGCTITFQMALWHAVSAQVSAAASIVGSPTNGEVLYSWGADDTSVPEVYEARMVVTKTVEEVTSQQSYPNGEPWEIVVTAAIPS